MKYCGNCGNPMSDDMKFCQKCGTKFDFPTKTSVVASEQEMSSPTPSRPVETPKPKYAPLPPPPPQKQTVRMRGSMRAWTIVCFVFAAIYALISLAEVSMLGMTFFCAILGFMFLGLGYTPKKGRFMYSKWKQSRFPKAVFVSIFVTVAFVVFVVFTAVLASNENSPNDANVQDDHAVYTTDVDSLTVSSDSNVTDSVSDLSGVEAWYQNQIPAVANSFATYGSTFNGVSKVKVEECKFRFGEDSGWYDCHYTVYFTCTVNGVSHRGEARGFLKYQEDTITWFHFEIFSNKGTESLVEIYDESFDKIIEDYYKELASKF